jgi:hypothetical protein
VRKASPGTYAMLENKLGWAPGSIDAILAGGEPHELVVKQRRTTHKPLAHTTTDARSRASTEEHESTRVHVTAWITKSLIPETSTAHLQATIQLQIGGELRKT